MQLSRAARCLRLRLRLRLQQQQQQQQQLSAPHTLGAPHHLSAVTGRSTCGIHARTYALSIAA
jgi:hypothetical protein